MTLPVAHHAIYNGVVTHKRWAPTLHQFTYRLYMMAIDLNDLEQPSHVWQSSFFGTQWYKPVRFRQKDYVQGEPSSLKQRIVNKVKALGCDIDGTSIQLLVQCRTFGVYFSPINFYFCQNQDGSSPVALVEVSNTPWNERHYYLIDLLQVSPTNKAFHVSPFMDLNMKYHWQLQVKDNAVVVKIENRRQEKLFEANLALKRQAITNKRWLSVLSSMPAMGIKIVMLIYWQALKLFLKKVPFVSHPKRDKNESN